MPKRCGWVKISNPLYIAYHDEEWGRPLHDDQALFELLCMETYQAGLSWETVLNKRQAFRESFHGYHLQRVANAQAFLQVQEEFGSFDAYLWSFVGFKTIDNEITNYKEAPAKTELSETMSKALKKQGFKFVGPVCVYSFLEAAGLINDHEKDCDFNSHKNTV